MSIVSKVILATSISLLANYTLANEAKKVIYPVLKNYDWPAKKHAVINNYNNIDQAPIPVIAYGYDTPENYVFITKYDKGIDVQNLHQQAIDNLCVRKYEFKNITENALTISGDTYSSEMFLCPSFLEAVEKKLGTNKLQVSIPRRTILYVAKADLSKEESEKFMNVVAYTLADDSYGNALITNLVIELEDGKMTGGKLVN